MFVKITGSKNRQYVQIVRSFRQNGQVKHEVLLNLGRLDVLKKSPEIIRFIKRLTSVLESPMIEVQALKDAEVLNWGWKVYKRLWDRYGVDEILERIKPERVAFDFKGSCFLMAVEHLLSPKSKL